MYNRNEWPYVFAVINMKHMLLHASATTATNRTNFIRHSELAHDKHPSHVLLMDNQLAYICMQLDTYIWSKVQFSHWYGNTAILFMFLVWTNSGENWVKANLRYNIGIVDVKTGESELFPKRGASHWASTSTAQDKARYHKFLMSTRMMFDHFWGQVVWVPSRQITPTWYFSAQKN